jgi:hypothetical protein
MNSWVNLFIEQAFKECMAKKLDAQTEEVKHNLNAKSTRLKEQHAKK